MRFGKTTMFLALNGIIAFGLVVYFATWWLGGKTNATIVSPYNSITITVKYQAKEKEVKRWFNLFHTLKITCSQ